jgi:hypothetical protein
MFQICVPNQKVQGKKQCYIFETFLNAMTKNIKIQILLVLLQFQNLWNLINILIKDL